MQDMKSMAFFMVLASIFVVWAILVWIFGGEKYKKWFYQFKHPDRYDSRKFKMVHVCFLFLAAICFFLMGLLDRNQRDILFIVFLGLTSIHFYLTYSVCMKKTE